MISVNGANAVFTGRFLVPENGTILQIVSGGLVHVADDENAGKTVLAAGSLNVREMLTQYGGSEITGYGTITAATIANAGLIVASGGTLMVNGSITGTGSMQIASGAALELNGSAVATQNIQFGANANKLLLETPSATAAHILDFATGDTIDLLSKTSTKLAYTSGLLTVSNGTTLVAKLEVKGSYTTANFKLASDGHGGSLISYVASSAVEPRLIGEPVGIASPHVAF
jgi:hypothetical protein